MIWRGFFLILGGTPRSKRLNFYGQTAVFAHFIRNRHFSGGPITDKESIFIDVSVNDSDFDKFSAAHHLLNHGQNIAFRYFATFEVARAEFGAGGRTFFRFSLFLFYFQLSMDRFRPLR